MVQAAFSEMSGQTSNKHTLYIYICVCVCVCVCVEEYIDIYSPNPVGLSIYVDDYRYIYSPTPVGLSSLANEVIVLPLAFIASLFIYELRSW